MVAAFGSHPIPTVSFEQFHKVANLHVTTINLCDLTVNIATPNGGVDRATALPSSCAGPMMMRNTLPWLRSNDLLGASEATALRRLRNRSAFAAPLVDEPPNDKN